MGFGWKRAAWSWRTGSVTVYARTSPNVGACARVRPCQVCKICFDFVCALICIDFPSEQADHAVPRPVQAIRSEVTGASAGMCHSVFVTAGGVVFTCGDGHDGRLGHRDDSIRLKPMPVATFVQNMVHAVAVQAGGAHTLVLSNVGEVNTYVLMLERTDMSGKLGMKSKAYVFVEKADERFRMCTCFHVQV